jgi:hypothetical protein
MVCTFFFGLFSFIQYNFFVHPLATCGERVPVYYCWIVLHHLDVPHLYNLFIYEFGHLNHSQVLMIAASLSFSVQAFMLLLGI